MHVFILAPCYADVYKREESKLIFEETGLKRSATGKSSREIKRTRRSGKKGEKV